MDYSPVAVEQNNLILFCSRRPSDNKKNMDGDYYEDIFYSNKTDDKWSQSKLIDKSSGYISKEVNEGKEHSAPVSLSADGKTLYIYKRNGIWKSTKDAEGKWSIPIRMNQNVNIGDANPSIFITPDATEMFIVSTGVVDGYGDRDLYYSKKDDNGNWKKPVNMGPKINTKYKEDAPYLSKDGTALYFASEGHNSMGGFDIYRSLRDQNGNWGEPMNIGTPVNSSGDDIYYIENGDGTLAYYASMRPGSYGHLDIYTAKYECQNIPTTEVKGYAIYAENHLPVSGIVKVTNKATGEEMGTFTIDRNTGKYQMLLPPENTYIVELVAAQTKYSLERPFTDEFFLPKQCVAYNLFQQVELEDVKNEEGDTEGLKATFTHAYFDIDKRVQEVFKIDNFTYNTPELILETGITGNIAHDELHNAKDVEVVLLDENDKIVRIDKTNENGDFAFERVNTDKEYKIMINEEDAKQSFEEQTNQSGEDLTLQGITNKTIKDTKIPNEEVTVYLGNDEKEVVNVINTDENGEFKFDFENEEKTLAEVEKINDETNIEMELDVTDAEIVYSALITTIEENGDEKNVYTENVDIVELQEIIAMEQEGLPIPEDNNATTNNIADNNTTNQNKETSKEENTVTTKEDPIVKEQTGKEENITSTKEEPGVKEQNGKEENIASTKEDPIVKEQTGKEENITTNQKDPVVKETTTSQENKPKTVETKTDVVKTEAQQLQEFANILFDFDKYFLRDKSINVLKSLQAFLDDNPSVQIRLDGHADWIGTVDYNEALSEKRALAAHKFLIDNGISPDRIENAWFGESKPVAANANNDGSDNPQNRQLNRRVEIKVEIPEMAALYLSL